MGDLVAEAVQYSSDAIQAIENLNLQIGSKNTQLYDENVLEKVHASLDGLRTLKASLEGSDHDFPHPEVSQEGLVELKQLTLMHVPSSLTPEARDKFTILVEQALAGQMKQLVSINLLVCPWYELSQRERGEQAKHNILLVVFLSYDHQFFSPANPQAKEKASIVDFGWFCAVEMSHFGQALARGRTRYVEAVFCRDGADIYSSEDWMRLKESLDYMALTGSRGYLEACLGQAVGAVGKKRNGQFKLIEGATFYQICESYRLLQLAHNSLLLKSNQTEVTETVLPPTAVTALAKILSFYEDPEPVQCKLHLFDLLIAWADELKAVHSPARQRSGVSDQESPEAIIGTWMMETRLHRRELTPSLLPLPDSHSHLVDLMQHLGGPMSKIKPEQIILVAVAGSAMYNLNIPTSDVDYLVIYSIPTKTILSSTKKLTETYESRGVDKDLEYGAYEARTFCEMLLKCSVVMLELLFADTHSYMSPMWQDLAQNKKAFITERAIQQYLGLIKNNLKSLQKGKHLDSPNRDRKLIYQILHKTHGLGSMIKGEIPQVRVEGPTREFMMNVRTQKQEEWSREILVDLVTYQYNALREEMCRRRSRLREHSDYDLCTHWLLKVRGISEKQRNNEG